MLFLFFAYYTFLFLWLAIMVKKLLFWVYLWQLKEYHFLRLIDHFQTHKGKKIIFNLMNLLKIISIFAIILIPQYFIPSFLLLSIYLLEAYFFVSRIFKRKLLRPVLTSKTLLILGAGVLLSILFVFGIWHGVFFIPISKAGFLTLALIDFLAPLLFSIFILSFQPFILIWQKRLLAEAKRKRKKFKNLVVVGIAGSYGKSSTKEFLALILSEKFNVLKTSKNQNSEVGIARLILNDLGPGHEIFVCEIGAYNKGKIKQVCNVVQPQIGILTGINEQHMAIFGSQNNIIKAKFELLDALPKDGTEILNWDNELISSQNRISKLKTLKCSVVEQIKDLDIRKDSASFSIERIDFRVDLVGRQNVENLLLAISCARELGMNLEEISRVCKKIKPFEKTMQLTKGVNGVRIIDDSYSANPKGVMAALEHLKLFSGKKIVIMPCLIELGEASKRAHIEIGESIGNVCDMAIITTKDRFEEIKKGDAASGMEETNILFLERPTKIFEAIKPFLNPENIILLESRMSKKLSDLLIRNENLKSPS